MVKRQRILCVILFNILLGMALLLTPPIQTTATVTSTPAVAELEVISFETYDLVAGPAHMSAHLAPDGEQFIYFGTQERSCIYRFGISDCTRLDDALEFKYKDKASVQWSPDSRFIAFSQSEGRPDIWLVDAITGGAVNLTGAQFIESRDRNTLPQWSEDSKSLLFVHYPGTEAGEFGPPVLFTITRSRSELKEVIPLADHFFEGVVPGGSVGNSLPA
jgi:dipeptidyl aminopeptidase/acylaminoacyl peptidase